MTGTAWSAGPVLEAGAGQARRYVHVRSQSMKVGAAKTHTAQTIVKPIATSGTTIASPAGIRAR